MELNETMDLKDLRQLMGRAFIEAVPQREEGEAEFIRSIESKELLQSFFICLIYRMPLEDLKKMREEGRSVDEIERCRNAYIIKMATDLDPLAEKMKNRLSSLDDLIRNTRETTDYLKKEVSDVWERERSTLCDQVEDLKSQRARDQELISQYYEELKVYKERLEEYREKLASTAKTNLQKEKSVFLREDDKEEIVRRTAKIKERHAVREEYAGFMERRRQKRLQEEYVQEIDSFAKDLIRMKELSKEQKDYLLSALEEGHSFRVVRQVMIPTLTVEQMQKFIRIYENHKEYIRKK